MKTIETPYIPGDMVWTFKDECVTPLKTIKCEECDHKHHHEPTFKIVPVKAKVERISYNGIGWSVSVGWREKPNKSFSGQSRYLIQLWETENEAKDYCDTENEYNSKQDSTEGNRT